MDITLCNNDACEKHKTCRRFLLKNRASGWQSWVAHGNSKTACEVYWKVGEGHTLACGRDDASSSPQ